ncbi:hypothetical protein CW703_03860 [Candidatus Bathyarchaeota archaeon]|nr:MAG: hypothetical protein CW703_03860 [Candidatus Bathyarchaeota archaeon]
MSEKLSDEEVKILESIRSGRNFMTDFVDGLGLPPLRAAELTEKLEQAGYIVRDGYTGSKYYMFHLTEKGLRVLPKLTPEEEELAKDGLTKEDLLVLSAIKKLQEEKKPIVAETVSKASGVSTTRLVTVVNYLIRIGCLSEHGMIRRHVKITAKGEELLNKHKAKITSSEKT